MESACDIGSRFDWKGRRVQVVDVRPQLRI